MPSWIPGKQDQKTALMKALVRVYFYGEDTLDDIVEKDDKLKVVNILEMRPIVIDQDEEIEYREDSKFQISVVDIDDMENEEGIDVLENVDESEPVEEKPFDIVEQMPSYPGGGEKMEEFIQNNLKYPKSAQVTEMQGRVIVRFVVEKDGAITNVETIKGIHKDYDEEAVRLVKSFPNWIPGKQNGQAVRVYMILPIAFFYSKNNN